MQSYKELLQQLNHISSNFPNLDLVWAKFSILTLKDVKHSKYKIINVQTTKGGKPTPARL